MEMSKYKPYLEEFNYPNIDSFNEDQIGDIFTAENRCTLLTWLIKHLNSQFIITLECSETTQTLFADFFHETGFCKSSEKLPFVKGDPSLSIEKQIIIFDRIFNFLKNTPQKENIEPIATKDSSKELDLFLKKDLNLFPAFGPMKLCTSTERQQKVKNLKEAIEQIRRNLGNHFNNYDIDFGNAYDYEQEEEIEKNLEKFKKQAVKLQEISSAIQKVRKSDDFFKKVGFKFDFENQLTDCNAEVMDVLQYFQTMNLTHFLDTKALEEYSSVEQNEILRITKQHADNSAEVVKKIKKRT